MADSKSPHDYTLALALGSAFSLVAVLGTALVGIVIYFALSHVLRGELAHRLSHTSGIAAMHVDAEQHALLQDPEDEQSDYHKKLKVTLQRIQAQSDDVPYVYTVRMVEEREPVWVRDGEVNLHPRPAKAGGEVVFVVDADPVPGSAGRLRQVYDDAPALLRQALLGEVQPNHLEVFVSEDFYTDQWGTFLSGYIPILDEQGDIQAMLCTDISAESVLAHERKYKLMLAALCGLVALVTIPIGLTFASWIRNPLRGLGVEMNRIGKLELDDREPVHSRIIEVNEMNHEMKNMKNSLRSFSKYVPARLVRQLLEAGMEAELGGKKKEMSIFFSDIADFTPVSERLSPEQLVDYLGQYFEVVAEALLDHGATVDKYIGDAVMAFWNAPVSQADHACLACKATLECMKRIDQLNQRWADEGHDVAFNTRFGVHTGDVIVGNMGSEKRLAYTIMGDNVNLASRLEGANKAYGTQALISGATYAQVKDKIAARRIDRVAVKGKSIPIDFYELLGMKSETDRTTLERIDSYEAGFDLYLSRQFGEAEEVFRKLLDRVPGDAPAVILRKRCRQCGETPPPKDWDGSHILTEK